MKHIHICINKIEVADSKSRNINNNYNLLCSRMLEAFNLEALSIREGRRAQKLTFMLRFHFALFMSCLNKSAWHNLWARFYILFLEHLNNEQIIFFLSFILQC